MANDILKILVASDIHLGFAEKDPIRCNDSFNTFEEILQIAVSQRVDFMLLGGDLFHENKPSRSCLHSCISLLRKYCLGISSISSNENSDLLPPCSTLEYLTQEASTFLDLPDVNFKGNSNSIRDNYTHEQESINYSTGVNKNNELKRKILERRKVKINYLDPDLNITLPVFSVHGNHDDPTGKYNLSAIDILASTGLLNHFGRNFDSHYDNPIISKDADLDTDNMGSKKKSKATNHGSNLDRIYITPLLFRKGKTKLALYGLGSIRDERLHRLMAYKNVVYLRPESSCPADNFKVPTMDSNGTLGERNGNELNGGDDGHVEDEYFNLFVLHQNRTKHGPTNYIPEHFLEDFLDLVIWGHEHECLIDPQWNAEKSFFVSQPGSSIATSLSAGEAVPKHVALLQIKNKSFKMNKIPLKTVRPFVILDSKPPSVPSAAKLFLLNAMENALKNDIPRLITGDPRQPTLPLIRIRVEYDEKLDFLNPIKFGQAFVDTVANPKDIIHFLKKKNESTEHKEDRLALKKFMTKTCPFDPVLLEGTGQDGSSDVFGSLSVSGVEELVKTFLDKAGTINQLSILTEKGLGLAIRQFIDKQEFDSISELVGHQLHKIQKDLIEKQNRENIVNEEILDKAIIKFKEARILRQLTQQERDERRISTANTNGGGEIDGSGKDDNVDILLEEDSDIEDRIPISSGAMEGRSRGKGNDNDDRQINSSNIAKTKKNRQDSSFPSILSRGINDDDFDNPFVDKTSDHNTSKNKTRSAEIDAQRTKSDKGGDANFTSDSDDDLISQFASGQEAATLSQNKSDKGGSKNSESISLFTDTRNHENDGGIVGNSNGSLIDLDDMEVDIYDSCDSVDVEVARKSTRKTATTTTTLKESKQGAKKPNPKSTKNPKNTEPKGTSSGKDIRSYYSSSQLSFSSHGAQKPKKDSGDTIISKTTRSTKNKKVFRI